MIKFTFSIVLALISNALFSQDAKYEERALQYFFENILPSNYEEGVSVKFKNRTEVKYTRFGIRDNCFDKQDYKFYSKLDSSATKMDKLDGNFFSLKCSIPRTRLKRGSKGALRVYKSTPVDGRYYVEITLNFNSNRSDSYFIELNNNGLAIKYCKNTLIY